MRLISYGGKAYVTDGHSKRYVPTPEILNNLLAAAGQTGATPVAKATFDFLEDHVSGSSQLLATNNVAAMVETNRRVILDLHS